MAVVSIIYFKESNISSTITLPCLSISKQFIFIHMLISCFKTVNVKDDYNKLLLIVLTLEKKGTSEHIIVRKH